MRCDDFTQWLQQRLDDRADLSMPTEINDHVVGCESCRGQLNAWNQISSILPVDRPPIRANDQPTSGRVNVMLWVSAAATVLLAFFVGQRLSSDAPVVVQVQLETQQRIDSDPESSITLPMSVDPASLWQDIQSRDWIAQSMPAIESVRDSIAPMRRSVVQAMTILATGGRDQPS